MYQGSASYIQTVVQTVIQAVKKWLAVALDFILPPRCPSCKGRTSDHHHLCGDCFAGLHFIAAPKCVSCGMPFDIVVEDDPMCGACLGTPPLYDWAASALAYDKISKAAILRLKHAGALENAPHFARLLVRLLQEKDAQPEICIAVPLHARRLFQRGFNQSAEIARHLAPLIGAEALPLALSRHRNTPSQAGLTRRQRWHNVSGAFKLDPKYKEALKDKHIILVDDVMTTGATIEACCKALKKAKPASIGVVTLARVLPGPEQGENVSLSHGLFTSL